MLTHAVLSTDFSKASELIINNALELQHIGVEKISLVHVYSSLVNVSNIKEVEKRGIVSFEESKEKLEVQKNALLKQGFIVESDIVLGIPSKKLRTIVTDLKADFLIMGSNGQTETDNVLGSTAYEVLTQIEKPVLLMVMQKKESNWELLSKNINKHILLPTDFSDFAESAFQTLKSLKSNIGELTLMHIQDEVRIKDHLADKLDEFNNIDTARLKRLKEAFSKAHPETKVNIIIDYGKPKEQILNYINTPKENNISLTVMGSQGRGFLSRLFLGSASHYVARHADSNVLLVPIEK